MDRDELLGKVRELRAKGAPPKAVARALGLTPAQVAPLVRAVAAEAEAVPGSAPVVGCWVSPGWSVGLTVDGHPEWPDVTSDEPGVGSLASVLVVREGRRGRVSACGYLVDTYCLGVKNAIGPHGTDPHALRGLVADYFSAYGEAPVAAPLELAQHLVFGAVEYARSLGFEPHPDFAAAAAHLGPWTGPSAITFGRNGKPLFVQGPHDDAAQVIRALERTAGRGNFDFLMAAGRVSAPARGRGWSRM
ncbi:MAG TPA: hypothetical protein VFM54_00640 [Micromonosporaceae bacterium]|nr:hypothetical protein [Micromonosporaceae bacterium]